MKPNVKICIPVPCEEYYYLSKVKDSIDALKENSVYSFTVCLKCGPCVAVNRNNLVNDGTSNDIIQNIKTDFTHILFVDSDISFAHTDVCRLLHHKKQIVSGAYLSKANDKNYEAWDITGDGINGKTYPATSTGLIKIKGGSGLGFCLIEIGVFNKIQYPWFAQDVIKSNNCRASVRSEDGYFALRTIDAEIEYWIDFDCIVKHFNIKPKQEMTMQEVKPQQQQQQVFDPDKIVGNIIRGMTEQMSNVSEFCGAMIREMIVREQTIQSQAEKIKELNDTIAGLQKKKK